MCAYPHLIAQIEEHIIQDEKDRSDPGVRAVPVPRVSLHLQVHRQAERLSGTHLERLALRPRTPCGAKGMRAHAAQRYKSTAVSIRSVISNSHYSRLSNLHRQDVEAGTERRTMKSDVVCSMRMSQRSRGVCKNNINFDPSDIPADQPMCTPCESCHTGKPAQLATSTLMNP